jgi:tRNA/rRNA methyltransferase
MTEAERGQAPAIILVRPQMGENIGMAARAMANFGLSDLRLVSPRDGWGAGAPVMQAALDAAVGASAIVAQAGVYSTVEAASGDLHRLYATTARARGQAKVVFSAEEAVADARQLSLVRGRAGVLFGPERTGLDNNEVALADAIISYPVDPAHPSLNLAQAVSLFAYVWRTAEVGSAAPFALEPLTPPATRDMFFAFFADLDQALEAGNYFIPDGKRAVMSRNLHNIFHRLELSEADIRTLRGVVVALSRGRVRRAKG